MSRFYSSFPRWSEHNKLLKCFEKCKRGRQALTFYCLMLLTCTPLCLGYFLLLDVIFAFYCVISSLIYLVTFGGLNIGNYAEDYVFKELVGMTRMELIGYRRLRTLSQILFESLPQMVLQLRIISVINHSDSSVSGSFEFNSFNGVSTNSLFVSVLFACLHILFEGLMIYLDSQACSMPFWEYAIICLNARLNWVPYSHLIESTYTYKDSNVKSNVKMLDFEKIYSKFFCFNYKLDYQFSDLSFKSFEKYLSSLLPFSQQNNRKTRENESNFNVS